MEKQKKTINFKYNLKVYFSILKKYKGIFLLILIFAALMESRVVIDRYLFKIIIDKGTDYNNGILTLRSFKSLLVIIAIIYIFIIIFNAVIRWFNLYFVNKLEGNLIYDLKRKYFDHIISLDHGFHVSHKTGSLISRLSRGGGATERLTDSIVFNLCPLIFESIIAVSSILFFDHVSALIIFVTTIVFISYSFFIQRFSESTNLEANYAEDIEKGNTADIFTNIDSIQYFGKEETIKKKFESLVSNTRQKVVKNWNIFNWLDSGQSLILGLGIFTLVFFSISKFLAGGITLGTLAFIYTIFLSLIGNMYSFVGGLRGFYRSMADYQDLFEYGKIEKQIKDLPTAKKLVIKNGDVEFKKVDFNYGKRKIFEDFNLIIPRNKKVAFVGHSGSGKTTLIKLLYRMYDINDGEIKVDGIDIRDVKQESLRSEMSIVPQECILFDDTIYNNVAFSSPKASKEEVMEAIKFAQLDKIIKSFPNKEQTIVGERGVKLSGGEKQRVSIARAILANKKILVLDEATSSLDSQTEHEIQSDLEKLMKGRTSIIIAHRLSTIMKADIIVVMKNGKIVQKGTHNQLIKEPGEYRHLWNLQKGGYIKS
ncbi:Molybdate/tungstate import ATP-binding protein WtpC [uncultured archaeon]|nr:Molybdate/tungstate import ATP-binding protein WtpC [uncultured archaeon]